MSFQSLGACALIHSKEKTWHRCSGKSYRRTGFLSSAAVAITKLCCCMNSAKRTRSQGTTFTRLRKEHQHNISWSALNNALYLHVGDTSTVCRCYCFFHFLLVCGLCVCQCQGSFRTILRFLPLEFSSRFLALCTWACPKLVACCLSLPTLSLALGVVFSSRQQHKW